MQGLQKHVEEIDEEGYDEDVESPDSDFDLEEGFSEEDSSNSDELDIDVRLASVHDKNFGADLSFLTEPADSEKSDDPRSNFAT